VIVGVKRDGLQQWGAVVGYLVVGVQMQELLGRGGDLYTPS
jgi:hypothetical protein